MNAFLLIRHCEPTVRARPMTGSAKQSRSHKTGLLRRFARRNEDFNVLYPRLPIMSLAAIRPPPAISTAAMAIAAPGLA
ncbi:MAG: hypothetical protein QOJ86_1414 [Bradyrhizobium sp.]|nr:hypothetical protein [Bradyrhizobium sp.]